MDEVWRNEEVQRSEGEDLSHGWAGREVVRLSKTRPWHYLKWHTPLVRDLAGDNGEAHRTLMALCLLPFIPGVLFAVLVMRMWPFWLALICSIALIVSCCVLWPAYEGTTLQRADRLDTAKGLMGKREARHTLSGAALAKTANRMLPTMRQKMDAHGQKGVPIPPCFAGVRIGTVRGTSAWLTAERPVYVLAPARSGKTSSIVDPIIVESQGAVIATSSRDDILRETWDLRANGYTIPGRRDYDGSAPERHAAPCYLFDPMGLADTPEDERFARHRIYWNPVADCTNPDRARKIAITIVGTAHLTGDNAAWNNIGVELVQALLMAAALDHKGFDQVFDWSQSSRGCMKAASIIRANAGPGQPAEWAGALEQLSRDDPRTASNKLLTLTSSLSPLSIPKVRQWFTPEPDKPQFNMERFIRQRGTVYLLAGLKDPKGADATTSVFNNLFLDYARDTARKIARAKRGKVEPPLVLALDEAPNIAPWAGLPQMFTAGSGDGIWPILVSQSLSLTREAWGDKQAATMWDNGQKVILSGVSDPKTMHDISTITGRTEKHYSDASWRGMGLLGHEPMSMSGSERTEQAPVLSPNDIREIPIGRGLVISRDMSPAVVSLVPDFRRGWKTRLADAPQYVSSAQQHREPESATILPAPPLPPHEPETVSETQAEPIPLGKLEPIRSSAGGNNSRS